MERYFLPILQTFFWFFRYRACILVLVRRSIFCGSVLALQLETVDGGTHLDLQELGEAEDDGKEDGGRDVVHGPDQGGAVGGE